MWESMRILLPEHKEALLEHRRQQRIQVRPILEEQELERIGQAIHGSLEKKKMLTLIKHGQFENQTITGIVENIDMSDRRVKIADRWIYVSDIIGIEDI